MLIMSYKKVKEESIVEVPHIDFILGDQRWKLRDCDMMMQILDMILVPFPFTDPGCFIHPLILYHS